jgi:gas vesicle protein
MNTKEVSCFVSGLSLGVAMSVFFAPRAGRDTRSRIHDKFSESRQKLREKKEAAYEALNRQKGGVSAALDAAKSAYQEATGGTQ